MRYSILDDGNLVASFDGDEAAYGAIERLADDSDEARHRLLLVVFDADGTPVADCAPGERIVSVS